MTGITELGRSAIESVFERVGRGVGQVQERKPLPYDLLETDTEYLVIFDAPGVRSDDIQVRFIDSTLEVRIDRFREFYEGFEMRFPGRGLGLSGTVELPDDASVTGTDASAAGTLTRSGTLQVRIPKSDDSKTVTVTEAPDESDATDPDRSTAGSEASNESTPQADGGETPGQNAR
ncbi:MAG: Hsp20/alpha crystallin family protein [Halobacteriota archaeon]